jgi:hypothetical protein
MHYLDIQLGQAYVYQEKIVRVVGSRVTVNPPADEETFVAILLSPLQVIEVSPQELRAMKTTSHEESSYDDETRPYEDNTRPCAHCRCELAWSFPYAYCETCQETQTCQHGVLYKEDCNACNALSDFAYDAWRERRSTR